MTSGFNEIVLIYSIYPIAGVDRLAPTKIVSIVLNRFLVN